MSISFSNSFDSFDGDDDDDDTPKTERIEHEIKKRKPNNWRLAARQWGEPYGTYKYVCFTAKNKTEHISAFAEDVKRRTSNE